MAHRHTPPTEPHTSASVDAPITRAILTADQWRCRTREEGLLSTPSLEVAADRLAAAELHQATSSSTGDLGHTHPAIYFANRTVGSTEDLVTAATFTSGPDVAGHADAANQLDPQRSADSSNAAGYRRSEHAVRLRLGDDHDHRGHADGARGR